MFRLAVAHGAANINPVRETGKISGGKKRPRALSRAEMDDLSDRLRTLPRALPPQVGADPAEKPGLDLADLIDWMLATGCRIGEALAAARSRTWTETRCSTSRPGRGRSTPP
jgi:integrase